MEADICWYETIDDLREKVRTCGLEQGYRDVQQLRRAILTISSIPQSS